ncbi:hypothetical protein A2U01_0042373, partial [Trifolium medium]|nr:hypothetical protein [Trifolium medium]
VEEHEDLEASHHVDMLVEKIVQGMEVEDCDASQHNFDFEHTHNRPTSSVNKEEIDVDDTQIHIHTGPEVDPLLDISRLSKTPSDEVCISNQEHAGPTQSQGKGPE